MVSKDKRKLVEKAKKAISEARMKRDNSHTFLKASMEDHGDRIYESLQNWMDNCLKYIEIQLSHLEPLSSSEKISSIAIRTMWTELSLLQKEFRICLRIKSFEVQPAISADNPLIDSSIELLPFDPSVILHVNKTMIPLVIRICALMRLVDAVSSEYLEIKDYNQESEDPSQEEKAGENNSDF